MANVERTVIGLFDTTPHAETAVRALKSEGFTEAQIGVAMQSKADAAKFDATTATPVEQAAGAGAVTGTVVGGLVGLLAGFGTIVVPGVGPVAAAGTLSTVLGSTALGAGVGAAAGGVIGALVGLGVPEEEAHVYAEGLKRGGTLVSINTHNETEANKAVSVLRTNNAVDIDKRREEYRSSGWTGYTL